MKEERSGMRGRPSGGAAAGRDRVEDGVADALLDLADDLQEQGRDLLRRAREVQRLAERMGAKGRPYSGKPGTPRSGPRRGGGERERRAQAGGKMEEGESPRSRAGSGTFADAQRAGRSRRGPGASRREREPWQAPTDKGRSAKDTEREKRAPSPEWTPERKKRKS